MSKPTATKDRLQIAMETNFDKDSVIAEFSSPVISFLRTAELSEIKKELASVIGSAAIAGAIEYECLYEEKDFEEAGFLGRAIRNMRKLGYLVD